MRHFKLTDKRYEELRKQILKAATEPLTQPELREAVGAEAPRSSRASRAQMTRDARARPRRRQGRCARTSCATSRPQIDDADADEALAWLAGEYLRAFGPIRAKDFRGGRA